MAGTELFLCASVDDGSKPYASAQRGVKQTLIIIIIIISSRELFLCVYGAGRAERSQLGG